MSKLTDEILRANSRYVESFSDKGELPMPPGRKLAILTCMDARLIPSLFAGLKEGDAHVIRNAGGRASDDAIRSLVISYKLLGTREWIVIHHTDCGMLTFTDDVMAELLEKSLEPAVLEGGKWKDVGRGPGSAHGKYVHWLAFDDVEASVADDVRRIREHPLVPRDIPIHGYVYDVKSGRLIEVPEATAVGKAA